MASASLEMVKSVGSAGVDLEIVEMTGPPITIANGVSSAVHFTNNTMLSLTWPAIRAAIDIEVEREREIESSAVHCRFPLGI